MPAELTLQFVDENGTRRRVKVDDALFFIGRTAENDLQISNGGLSRRHAKIERFADVFVLSDCGSSNGTQLNSEDLREPVGIQNGDKILLGGAVEIDIEIIGGDFAQSFAEANAFAGEHSQGFQSGNDDAGSSLKTIFIVAPLAGVFVLLLAGALLFALSGRKAVADQNRDIAEVSERPQKRERNADFEEEEEPEETPTPRRTSNSNDSANGETNSSSRDVPPPAKTNSELEVVEKNALQFLRRISSDPNPVLTGKQLELINAKIKAYRGSAAVRENLRTAQRSAANFQSIAQNHNFKPQFITVAALAKLGESRGEPLATANAISEDLKKLSNVLGTELANDALLVVAAHAEGDAPLQMRDRVANLAKQTPNVSAATVRTIWFLRENNKLSEAAFDFALRFIAVGAIAQNPKDFGVQTEALNL